MLVGQTDFIPMQARLPLINDTMYRVRLTPSSAALIQRSGLNLSGSGKREGSRWTNQVEVLIGVYQVLLACDGC